MDPLEAIRRAQATRLVDEDGDEVKFELAPALSPADIERLVGEVGAMETSGCLRYAPPEKRQGLIRRLFE